MRTLSRHVNLLLLLGLQLLITLKMWSLEGWALTDGIIAVMVAAVSVTLMVLLWNMLLAHLPRAFSLPINVLFVVGYLLLQTYHWLRHEPLTFLILYKNGHDLLAPEAVGFVFGSITPLTWLSLATIASVILVLQYRLDIFGSFHRFERRTHMLAVLLLANIGVTFAAAGNGNEYYQFARSVYDYLEPTTSGRTDALYPYLKTVSPEKERRIAKNPDRPHVFIVMLESFSALYMDRIENGRRVTPFLDELKHDGLFVENFYSASVETSKGQFATLCSVYPAYRANVFTRYPDNNFRCLSHILKENGYTNVFMKAFHSLGFENTGNFVEANAFDHAHGMDDNFVTKEERERYKFGWGIQDNIFYRKTFNYLDQLHLEGGSDSRFFVTTMSVTNHMMFDDIPTEQRFIYPDAKTHHENYSNSMHLTDRYLREFFEELNKRDYLKNSLVIVLGDNGFPMGQHNNFHNTKTGYNELFKMPFLMLWNNRIEPQTLDDRAYSQLDVAPTLLDLLGIETSNHFVGQSILRVQDETHFVPLIQPFDGTWLSSIRYPYKLMQHQRTGKEFLYNIESDPDESKDLTDTNVVDADLLERLRQDIAIVKFNELLLQENRIYPSGKGGDFRVRLPVATIDAGEPLRIKLMGEINEQSRIHVVAESIDPRSGKKREAARELYLSSARFIERDLFRPGINRLTVTTWQGPDVLHTFEQDIYVKEGTTELVSDLNVEGSQGWGKLGINRSVGARELTVNRQEFLFGLGTHAPSEHSISLAEGFSWFHTQFGLDDESRCGDGVIFEIWADSRRLYASRRLKHGKTESARVSVAGYKELKLVTLEGKSKHCDHANWLNPVLYRQNQRDTATTH